VVDFRYGMYQSIDGVFVSVIEFVFDLKKSKFELWKYRRTRIAERAINIVGNL